MRTSSLSTSASASSSTVVRVGAAVVSLTIEKWRSASEAIWGRWVMHRTCLRSLSSRRRAPTARAVCPPMPASTSSKTSVVSPAELAAGGDLPHRTRRHARVRGDQELDRVGSARAGLGFADAHLEARLAHRELAELLPHGGCERPRGRQPRPPHRRHALLELGPRRLELLVRVGECELG